MDSVRDKRRHNIEEFGTHHRQHCRGYTQTARKEQIAEHEHASDQHFYGRVLILATERGREMKRV